MLTMYTYRAHSPESTGFAVTDEPTVDTVTHATVKARSITTRTVLLTVVAMETGSTLTDVDRVRNVAAVSVILARTRKARVKASAVSTKETIVAVTVMVR